jgi:hypothetical protein
MNTLIRSSVFSDWLNSLKDQKAKARIPHRLSQASLDNFGIASRWARASRKCVSTMVRDSVSISCVMVPPSMCCFAVATSPASAAISPGQSAWRGNGRRAGDEEGQSQGKR